VPADIRDELQLAAQGSDVAGEGLNGGDLAVLDLGDPARGHAHDLRQSRLGETKRLPLGLDVAKDSDSASDYERSFRQTQRDDLRLLRRSDLREPDLVRLPQTKSLRMACRLAIARITTR